MEKKPRMEQVEEATRRRIVHHWPAVVGLLAIVAAFSVLSRTLAPYPIVLAGIVVVGLLLIILERLLERFIVVRTIAFTSRAVRPGFVARCGDHLGNKHRDVRPMVLVDRRRWS